MQYQVFARKQDIILLVKLVFQWMKIEFLYMQVYSSRIAIFGPNGMGFL